MQSKSPNTVNKVVEEVPSVGCTMGERRDRCPYCPTEFLVTVHVPSQKFYTNPYTVHSVIQSAWLATLLSLTSQRTSHPTCFSKNMALDASAINHILKISQLYLIFWYRLLKECYR